MNYTRCLFFIPLFFPGRTQMELLVSVRTRPELRSGVSPGHPLRPSVPRWSSQHFPKPDSRARAKQTPLTANAIFVVSPLTIALTSTTIQPISRYCGRIETILLIRVCGNHRLCASRANISTVIVLVSRPFHSQGPSTHKGCRNLAGEEDFVPQGCSFCDQMVHFCLKWWF